MLSRRIVTILGLKAHFTDVRHLKPKASRADSSEVYIAATGFKGR